MQQERLQVFRSTTLHNHNTNIALGSATILESKSKLINIKKHSPDAYPTRPTATTLHNHNTNIALGSLTILKSKSAPKLANKQVHHNGIASMHVDKINKEMMYDTQRKIRKKEIRT